MKQAKTIVLALIVAHLLMPADCLAQKKKDKKAKQTQVTAAKFNMQDPFDKANDNEKGTPWEATEVTLLSKLPDVKAAIPPPLPHVSMMSELTYNAAVSQAFESLRLVYGDLSEEQAKELRDAWAPLYNYPAQNVIDYLNKLNPLLSQFLLARENWMHTACSIDQLELDLINAVDLDNKEGFNQIYFEYRFYVNAQKQYAEAMIELANQIVELGNPPNPFVEMRRKRARYNQIFPEKKAAGTLGDCWLGTREVPGSSVAGFKPLTEPLIRYLFLAETGNGEAYFAIELGEEGTTVQPDTDEDPAALYNLRVHQIGMKPGKNGQKPDITSDGTFKLFFPNPPKMMITTLTISELYAFDSSDPTDEDKKTPELYAAKLAYHNAAGNYGNRVGRMGFFFKAALQWSQARKWDKYTYKNGNIPQKALDDFAEAVREEIRKEIEWKKLPKKQRKELAAKGEDPTAMPTQLSPEEAARQQAINDSIIADRLAKEEDIKRDQELIEQYQQDLTRDYKSIRDAYERLANATTSQERQNLQTTIDFYERQARNHSACISEAQDRINGNKTGEFRHTRNAWDAYTNDLMIQQMQIEARKYDYCKKLEAGIERQINLLPVEERAKAREVAEKVINEDGSLVNGDYQKMQRLRNALNSKIVGYATREQAAAEEEIVASHEKEFAANCTMMLCGALVAGIAPQAFATPMMTVGQFLRTGGTLAGATGSALTYANTTSKVAGMVYGGTLGFAAGGGIQATGKYVGGKLGLNEDVGIGVFNRPVRKAVFSGLGAYNIATTGAATFVDNFTEEENQGMPLEDLAWDSFKKAGTTMLLQYCMQKGIEKTVQLTSRGGNVKVQDAKKLSAAQKRDLLITKKEQLEAQDAIASFKKLEAARTKADWANNKAEVARLDKELDQLAASMNSSYQAKHQLKYSNAPDASATRARFDKRIQNIYNQEIPELNKSLEAKGWNVKDIQWKQFRNSSSVGSSSMDLDLGVVSKTNNYVEPVYIKNGQPSSPQEFLKDAQAALNSIHKQKFGISATASEMNITNSAHAEAFATTELLQEGYNWNTATPQTLKSIPKVLDAKTTAIDNNARFTETMKLQAKCREYSKEMENMLLPKLKQNLQTLKPGSAKYKQVQEDIDFMTEMTKKFKQIGSNTIDPMEILDIEYQIKLDTGGRGIQQVMGDVKRGFELNVP